MAVIKFGEWLPDQPDLENPGLTVAKGVIPGSGGYRPFLKQVTFSTTGLSATPRGAFSENDDAGASHTYAGDATDLYRLDASDFKVASSATSEFSLADDSYWEFAKWKNTVIAVSPEKEPHRS